MASQLPLDLKLSDHASFENFVIAGNEEAVMRVRAAAEGVGRDNVLLWGAAGTGKSHLLQAAVRVASARGLTCAYLPLSLIDSLSPAMLDDREEADIICIDDLQHIAGREAWERALFALYERRAASVLLYAAHANPTNLGLMMPELATRLSAGLIYQLRLLAEDDKLAALRVRATQRGLEMTEEVARYVLAHFPRDPHALFALLDRLDQAALREQRRLTIPFIREFA